MKGGWNTISNEGVSLLSTQIELINNILISSKANGPSRVKECMLLKSSDVMARARGQCRSCSSTADDTSTSRHLTTTALNLSTPTIHFIYQEPIF